MKDGSGWHSNAQSQSRSPALSRALQRGERDEDAMCAIGPMQCRVKAERAPTAPHHQPLGVAVSRVCRKLCIYNPAHPTTCRGPDLSLREAWVGLERLSSLASLMRGKAPKRQRRIAFAPAPQKAEEGRQPSNQLQLGGELHAGSPATAACQSAELVPVWIRHPIWSQSSDSGASDPSRYRPLGGNVRAKLRIVMDATETLRIRSPTTGCYPDAC